MQQPLRVRELLEALKQCENQNTFVKFHDSDTEKSFCLMFVEECVTTSVATGSIILLHRFEPELDNIACEPIKSVSRRTSTFARVEYQECEE